MLGTATGCVDQVVATQRDAGSRECTRDAGQAVRPVRHLATRLDHEPRWDERPVEAGGRLDLLGEQQVRRPRRQLGRAGHVVPQRPERAEQHARRSEGRVGAPPLGYGAGRLEPGCRPAVGRRQRTQPGDGEVGAGCVEGGQHPDRAHQAVEVVVLGRLGDPAYQRARRCRCPGRSPRRSGRGSAGSPTSHVRDRRLRSACRGDTHRARPGPDAPGATRRRRRVVPARAPRPTPTRPGRGRSLARSRTDPGTARQAGSCVSRGPRVPRRPAWRSTSPGGSSPGRRRGPAGRRRRAHPPSRWPPPSRPGVRRGAGRRQRRR